MNNEWKLLQLIDSASPTGAFSHSYGLETAAKEGKLRTKENLYEWMTVFVEGSLASTEGKACWISHQAVLSFLQGELGELEWTAAIQELDKRLFFSKLPHEGREAARKIGKRFLKNVNTLYPDAGLDQYETWIKEGKGYGSSAIVHGWISAYLELDPNITVFTFLYTAVNNLLQCAIRLNVVGQTDVQLMMRDFYQPLRQMAEDIVEEKPTLDDLHTFSIGQEIESMRHETLYSRLFMS